MYLLVDLANLTALFLSYNVRRNRWIFDASCYGIGLYKGLYEHQIDGQKLERLSVQEFRLFLQKYDHTTFSISNFSKQTKTNILCSIRFSYKIFYEGYDDSSRNWYSLAYVTFLWTFFFPFSKKHFRQFY